MRLAKTWISALTLVALLETMIANPAQAQPLPAPAAATAPKSADPKFIAAQAAFEALPEATRIAIQNDLVWVTSFSGAALGSFGRLTFEAIQNFQNQAKELTNGILTEKQRTNLVESANRTRAGVAFSVLSDANTGSGIGIPAKILTRQEKTVTGSKWTSQSVDMVLETVKTSPEKADMLGTFERFISANVPGRKVTYKLLRADFFVVSGEIGPRKFYTRFAPTLEGLRGYTLTYDAGLGANFERIVIATANTFEPLRGGNPPASQSAPKAAALIASPLGEAQPASLPARSGTALILASGKLLTASKAVEGCKRLSLAGKAARILANEPETGLALLSAESFGAATTLDLRETEIKLGEALVAFGFDANAPQHKLGVAPGTAGFTATGQAPTLNAALQAGAAGSLVLDRYGQIAGLVISLPPLNRQIAGILPLSAHRMTSMREAKLFLDKNGVKLGQARPNTEKTTGELFALSGKALVALECSL